MEAPREEPIRRPDWRRRLVALAVVLFPLLVAGGVLAPQVVSVMAEELENSGEPEAPALDFSGEYLSKPPLLLPDQELPGFIAELLDLQHLFTASRSQDLMSRQFARMLGFPRNHGDVIVLDDVDRKIQDVVFKDPIMLGATTDPLTPDPNLLSLDDPRPFGDGLRFDDPQGTGQGQVAPVPEPSTAVLLLGGLAVLAQHRQRQALRLI
jgi:hypothetical protein